MKEEIIKYMQDRALDLASRLDHCIKGNLTYALDDYLKGIQYYAQTIKILKERELENVE